MNKNEKFMKFLESLKGQGQDVLIESVKTGFQVCHEDVSPETDAILDIMNQQGITWDEAKKEYESSKTRQPATV